MAVDEQARHALHSRLEEMLGPEVTGTLMELLPPVGWADVATAHDVARGQAALGDRIDARISDVRTEIADLRTEMVDLRTDLRTEMADLRTEIADLRTHVSEELAEDRIEMAQGFGQVHREMAIAQRQLVFGVLGAMFTLTGLVWVIVGFAG